MLLFFTGIINLRDCTNIYTKELVCFPHEVKNIVEVMTTNRTYFLSADTMEIMQEWYDAIRSSLSELKETGLENYPDGYLTDEGVSVHSYPLQTSPLSNNKQQQPGNYVKLVGAIYEKPRSASCSVDG